MLDFNRWMIINDIVGAIIMELHSSLKMSCFDKVVIELHHIYGELQLCNSCNLFISTQHINIVNCKCLLQLKIELQGKLQNTLFPHCACYENKDVYFDHQNTYSKTLIVKRHMGENTIKGTRGIKVKVLFKRLHMTHVISMSVYSLKFCILDT